MDMLYQQPSLADESGKCPLAYKLVHLEMQDNEPMKQYNGDSTNYLKSFCDYAAGKNTDVEFWDHALMLTGRDLTADGSPAVAGKCICLPKVKCQSLQPRLTNIFYRYENQHCTRCLK